MVDKKDFFCFVFVIWRKKPDHFSFSHFDILFIYTSETEEQLKVGKAVNENIDLS